MCIRDRLSNGKLSILIISYAITFIATAVIIFFINKKDKDTTEAMKIIK